MNFTGMRVKKAIKWVLTSRNPGLLLRRTILRAVGYTIPSQLWIGVTLRCQCKCKHCVVFESDHDRENQQELKTEEIKRIINEAKANYIPSVVFFGGEPLLRSDIAELVAYSTSLSLNSILFTNGILLDHDTIQKLRNAGISQFNVSIDSSDPESHNAYRRYQGCFEKAVDGIRLALGEGIRCSIWTYASKNDVQQNNLSDLKKIISLGRELRVNNVFILFPIAGGRWSNELDLMLNAEEREKVRELYDPPFVLLEFPNEHSPCKAGTHLLYVNIHGEVTGCPCIEHTFGNILEQPLRSILWRFKKKIKTLGLRGCGECIINKEGVLERIGLKRVMKYKPSNT